MAGKPSEEDLSGANPGRQSPKTKTSFLQAVLLAFIAPLLFLGLLEGGLLLFGVEPILELEDPFVGFSGNVPLFEEDRAPNGDTILETARNKQHLFNQQSFPADKPSDTYRIFCLGGSTTYGRPYNADTAFPAWLQELLPAVDPNHNWEVINAGGISYASYRVARLMEELVRYQPDLFIIYTGQNEFLEERTYGKLRQMPEFLRDTVGLLAKTRTWSALSSTLEHLGAVPENTQPKEVALSAEVDAILDHSAGPKDYQRDDVLRDGVLEHFNVSLERMAAIAQKAGAQIIFVTPASNLKDCSPFKSEHAHDLDAAARKQVQRFVEAARFRLSDGDVEGALQTVDRAIAIDPRYAESHFLRGKILFALKQFEEAKAAFERARDEDVCPLRALTPMPDMVAQVARDQAAPLVDFVRLLERETRARTGQPITGDELFLDHVHPTIEGHKLLAAALLEAMIEQEIVQPDGRWNSAALTTAEARILSSLDPAMQTQALINLAKVLHWAGKFEDAQRLAKQGLIAAQRDEVLTAQASNILIKMAKMEGNLDEIDRLLREAMAIAPRSPILHYHLGMRLLQHQIRQQAASHILYARYFSDANETDSVLGLMLYKNGRPDLAYPLLRGALQKNPGDRITLMAFEELQRVLGASALSLPAVETAISQYPSGAPKEIYLQSARTKTGSLPDGIWTVWYEDGALKGYADYANGLKHGLEVLWDQDGRELSRSTYIRGVLSETETR